MQKVVRGSSRGEMDEVNGVPEALLLCRWLDLHVSTTTRSLLTCCFIPGVDIKTLLVNQDMSVNIKRTRPRASNVPKDRMPTCGASLSMTKCLSYIIRSQYECRHGASPQSQTSRVEDQACQRTRS